MCVSSKRSCLPSPLVSIEDELPETHFKGGKSEVLLGFLRSLSLEQLLSVHVSTLLER